MFVKTVVEKEYVFMERQNKIFETVRHLIDKFDFEIYLLKSNFICTIHKWLF